MNDIGCSESTKVLENAPGSEAPIVLVGNNSTHLENASRDVGVALVIDWKRTDVVYVQTLEWIVGCASEWMRLNEDFESTHYLAAWALAYEWDH